MDIFLSLLPNLLIFLGAFIMGFAYYRARKEKPVPNYFYMLFVLLLATGFGLHILF